MLPEIPNTERHFSFDFMNLTLVLQLFSMQDNGFRNPDGYMGTGVVVFGLLLNSFALRFSLQSLGVETLPPEPPSSSSKENNFSMGFADMNGKSQA